MLKWVGAMLDRVFAVVFAIVFAQMPLFIQQYSQQLVGRVAELQLQVESMKQSATLSGKSLEQLITRFLSHTDPDIARQGELMSASLERWNSLLHALDTLQNSNALQKPFAFLLHLNFNTFKSTWHHYSMGLPLTLEGGVYAFIGIIVGYGFFACLMKLIKMATAPFRKKAS